MKPRARTFNPAGEVMTLDDLADLVQEMAALAVPGSAVVRVRSVPEIDFQHGARVLAMTVVPVEVE